MYEFFYGLILKKT